LKEKTTIIKHARAAMKKVAHLAPGVLKLGPYGRHKNAVWLFVNGDEAALIEMPHYRQGREARPWSAAKRCLKSIGADLKYALISHAHIDHCQSLASFRETFQKTQFVAHRSQVDNSMVARLAWSAGYRPYDIFDHVFDHDIQVLDLNGEPLVLIHAPKHSASDVMMFYRGTALTGDWYMGDLKDCNALVHPAQKIESINRVQFWLHKLDYQVTRAFSGHGDCLLMDVDFPKLLEQSKIDHPLPQRRKRAGAL
jgi:hydroxyacylglutathione hydrolase